MYFNQVIVATILDKTIIVFKDYLLKGEIEEFLSMKILRSMSVLV